ncbi:MAG: ATP-binding protein [Muribaculaceae bacterium]|nr:ATP-binding protein [Muribaculaceae bacterium]
MDELRYPIGMQTFSKIIEEGYAYVDKTGYIKTLLRQGQYVFLSRPRRFGKSLLLSTLEAYFEGRRELFKGLAADRMDLDWTPSPVLRFDFNAENFSLENGLEMLIDGYLWSFEQIYGKRSDKQLSVSQRFKNLIQAAYEQTGRPVVILVDEYDKPLLDIQENKELFEKNQRILKSFYGNLKSMDRYIRFAFITGVARFSKVSIFSDLNNLKDISMDNTYADICGWTECELISIFRPGIERLAQKRDEDFDTTLKAMRDYYDGYLFADEGTRLYNPFSVLNALDKIKIDPYWFETGTPTFLARWVRNNGIDPREINGQSATKDELITVGFDEWDPVPLMFQTGYLTIGHYDRISELYDLRFPNREVEIGFFKHLLRCYAPLTTRRGSGLEFTSFRKDLFRGAIHDFMERLATLLKDLPGEDHKESTYRAVTYLLAVLCGTPAIAEHHGYQGRSDIEVFAGDFVYVFEFKYNKSVGEAMAQIHSRDYAGRYAFDSRTVYLIGANFNEKKEERGFNYEIEKMTR